MRLVEISKIDDISKPDTKREQVIKDFIDWAADKLNVDLDLIKGIEFSYNTKDAQQLHRTGAWDWHRDNMLIYAANRNLVDILRTVAHELQHVKQDQEHRIRVHSPPGSKLEQESDVKAGLLIKLYGKEHPEIFE